MLRAWPTDPYYDKTRPGWLPYWWDTPTESEAKYAFVYGVKPGQITDTTTAYPNPPAPPAVKPPANIVTPGPNAVDEVIARQHADWQQALRQFYSDLDAANNADRPTGPDWLLIGAAVIAAGSVFVLWRKS